MKTLARPIRFIALSATATALAASAALRATSVRAQVANSPSPQQIQCLVSNSANGSNPKFLQSALMTGVDGATKWCQGLGQRHLLTLWQSGREKPVFYRPVAVEREVVTSWNLPGWKQVKLVKSLKVKRQP
jgi:hypothetical protein